MYEKEIEKFQGILIKLYIIFIIRIFIIVRSKDELGISNFEFRKFTNKY